jgi:hypothetical protein
LIRKYVALKRFIPLKINDKIAAKIRRGESTTTRIKKGK